MSSLTNKKAVRQFALDHAAKTRAHKFTQVSAGFLAKIDAAVRSAVAREIQLNPSSGKTLS